MERTARRYERWRVKVGADAPDPASLGETCTVGTYSVLAEKTRRRFLVLPGLVEVGPWIESPTTVARDYLALHYPRWSPERWSLRWPRRWEVPVWWVPLAARPCRFTEGVYIDVRACYWRILERFGWGCIYVPGRYLGKIPPPQPVFPWSNHKVARNSLVSGAMPRVLQKFSPHRGYYMVGVPNRHLHIPLLHLVRDILHLLAGLAWDAGAVYVHTDGYIAPTPEVARIIRSRIEECGFGTSEAAVGSGRVDAVGAYRVGQRVSRTEAAGPGPLHQVVTLEDRDRRLLQKHLWA